MMISLEAFERKLDPRMSEKEGLLGAKKKKLSLLFTLYLVTEQTTFPDSRRKLLAEK